MDYEKLHQETLNKLQQFVAEGKITEEVAKGICSDFKIDKDEQIKRELLDFLETLFALGKNMDFDRWSKSDCGKWINYIRKTNKKYTEWDEAVISDAIYFIEQYRKNQAKNEGDFQNAVTCENWLKKLLKKKKSSNIEPKKKCIFTKNHYTEEDRKIFCEDCTYKENCLVCKEVNIEEITKKANTFQKIRERRENDIPNTRDKYIRDIVISIINSSPDLIFSYGITKPELMAWLNKQGEENIKEIAEKFARVVRGNLTLIDEKVQNEFELVYKEVTGEKMYGGFID